MLGLFRVFWLSVRCLLGICSRSFRGCATNTAHNGSQDTTGTVKLDQVYFNQCCYLRCVFRSSIIDGDLCFFTLSGY